MATIAPAPTFILSYTVCKDISNYFLSIFASLLVQKAELLTSMLQNKTHLSASKTYVEIFMFTKATPESTALVFVYCQLRHKRAVCISNLPVWTANNCETARSAVNCN